MASDPCDAAVVASYTGNRHGRCGPGVVWVGVGVVGEVPWSAGRKGEAQSTGGSVRGLRAGVGGGEVGRGWVGGSAAGRMSEGRVASPGLAAGVDGALSLGGGCGRGRVGGRWWCAGQRRRPLGSLPDVKEWTADGVEGGT